MADMETPNEGEKLRYDEDTMMKVAESIRTSLREILGQAAEEDYVLRKTSEIIGSMQNKHIVFRERV